MIIVPPFLGNMKPGTPVFVGSIIGNLVLAAAPIPGQDAYSPVNRYLYLAYASTVAVCDLSGTPSVVTTISMAATVTGIAYLPNSNKVFILQASHKYQLIDCVNNTAASQVTMTGTAWASPAFCNSFSVDQTNDDVYMCSAYQIGRVAPGTGVVTSPGFDIPDPGYASFLDSVSSVAFNNADGYLYVATGHAGHTLFDVDPATWSTVLKHDFGSAAAGLAATTSKFVINRSTGHVYINGIGGGDHLYVMTDYQTLTTITPTAQTERGDYDTVLQQVFEVESSNPGFVSVYSSSDSLLLRTSIGSGVIANPVAIYCDSLNGRYAIQKATGGETLQVIAR